MTATPTVRATGAAVPAAPVYSTSRAWAFTSFLLVVYILNWADKSIIGIAAQSLAKDFGLTTTQIGLLGTAFYAAFTVTGFSAGLLHRKLTLKWAIFVIVAVWALAMILPVLAVGGFTVVLISRIILGLGEGPAATLIISGVFSWHPRKKRGVPSSVAIATTGLSLLLVAPVMAFAVHEWGWRAAFAILAGLTVIWLVLWLFVWKDGPYAEAGAAEKDEAQLVAEPPVPWRRIFATPSFIGGAVAMFAAYSISAVTFTFGPTYFQIGLGFDQLAAGLLQSAVGLAGVVILVGAAVLGDRLIARGRSSRLARGIIPGAAMIVGSVLLIVLVTRPAPAVAVVLFSLGYALAGVAIPVLNAGISEIAPARQLSGTLTLFMGIMYVGALIAPTAIGAIVDAAGGGAPGWGVAWFVFGVLALVGGICALAFFNPPRDAKRVRG